MPDLTTLSLYNTRVTGNGFARPGGFPRLRELRLETEADDAGLEGLKGLTQLEFIDLNDSKVTDAGLCTSRT